jgi:hypothetical protein
VNACPQRPTNPVFTAASFKYENRPDDGTCDFCGSLDPDILMARLEAGDVILVPTDKNYKVYVRNKGGAPFRQSYRTDKMEDRVKAAAVNVKCMRCAHCYGNAADGYADTCAKCGRHRDAPDLTDDERHDAIAYENGDPLDPMRNWKWTTRETDETKFYFEHLSEDQKKRFVELLNEKRLRLDVPGHFYRRPFFIANG